MQHAGHCHVHGPGQRAVDCAGNVVALDGLTHHAQLLHGLHARRASGGINVGSRKRHIEALAADEFGVGNRLGGICGGCNRAVARREFGDWCVQTLRAELEQHPPCFGGDSAHRPAVAFDGVGTARAALVRRGIGAAHDEARLRVRHVELVAHHLPERRARALAAIRFADEEGGGVVRVNHDPRVKRKKIGVGVRTSADYLREHAGAGECAGTETQDQDARGRQKTAARSRRVEAAQCVRDHFR